MPMSERGYGSCAKYIQRRGEIDRVGEHLASLGASALVIVDPFIDETYGARVDASIAAAGVAVQKVIFGGECWEGEVDRIVAAAGDSRPAIIAGIGGGKTLDTAKLVAAELDARILCFATVASTDAPTSGLAMRYLEDGRTDRPIFLTRHPDMVIVDPELVVRAPVRFLIAGIGDALSTWYEARSNRDSRSKNYIAGGQGMPLAGMAIARACHEALMRDARGAVAAAREGLVTPAVENIIEANTLLSGLGFENCGCSAAHGIHNGLSILPGCHSKLHGEKVAFGTLCLLVLEDRPQTELDEVFAFCEDMGLPTTLEAMGLGSATREDLLRASVAALNPGEATHATDAELTPEGILASLLAVDAMGRARLARG
jgi:glycerol dehydrogenase